MAPKDVSVVIRAKNAVGQGLNSAKAQISSWAGSVRNLIGPLGTMLGAASVGAFFAKGIEEAQGAERAITQLGNTLANFGVNLDHVRPQVDAAIQSLQKIANVDDDDAIDGLNRLVGLSGNYAKSLGNLTLVADVAAKKQIGFSEAADIVGRAMSGQTKALREFGISTKDANDGIEQLRARVAGAATTEMGTFAGQVKATQLRFNDLAQEVGGVILDLPALQAGTGSVGGAFEKATKWIKENRVEVMFWSSVTIDAVKTAGVTIWNTVQIAYRAGKMLGSGFMELVGTILGEVLRLFNAVPVRINELIEAANRIPGVDIAVRMPTLDGYIEQVRERTAEMRKQGEAAFGDIVEDLKDVGTAWLNIGDSALNAAGKVKQSARDMRNTRVPGPDGDGGKEPKLAKGALGKAIDKREAADRKDRAPLEDWMSLGVIQAGGRAIQGQYGQSAAAVNDDAIAAQARASTANLDLPGELAVGGRGADIFTGAADRMATAEERAKSFGASIDDIAEQSIGGFADATANAFEAWISGSGNAADAFKSAVSDSIKSAALAEGKLNASKAIAALGEGLFTGKPNAFLAAAKYGAAAAGFFALAGAAGAMGGGGGGGGGRGAGSGSSRSDHDEARETMGRPVSITLRGSRTVFDHRNADDVDELKLMLGELTDSKEIDLVVMK